MLTRRSRQPPRTSSTRFYVLAAVVVACALLGGSSRADSPGLLVLRPLVVLLLGALVLLPGPRDWRSVRVPLLLLGAFAATIAIQLVPLPPGLWASLPGHAPLAASLALAGDQAGWRPISLDPDLTLNALVALLPALAVIVGFAGIAPVERRRLLGWLLGIVAASAVLGLVQAISGEQSPAYLYRHIDRGLPVGLLANRNHQAVLLALTIPALWVWARQPGVVPPGVRIAAAAGGTLVALPIILMTGSRAGMAAALAALVATPWISGLRLSLRRQSPRGRLALAGLAAAGLVLAGLALYTTVAGQALSVDRLAGTDVSAEKRVQALPVLWRMLADFFPVGLGHGAFEPVFRMYEPDALLMPTYFNRAHNDPLELAMSGGLPTMLVLAALLGWFVTRAFAAIRRSGSGAGLGRLGAFTAAGWMLASLPDYPLRAPLCAVLFVLACLWLEDAARPDPA